MASSQAGYTVEKPVCSGVFDGLSTLAWASICVVCFAVTLVIAADVSNIAVVPIAAIPPAVLIYILYYKWLRCVENQDDLFIRMFGFAFLPGAAITVGLEVVSSAVFSLIFIPEQIKDAIEGTSKQSEGEGVPYAHSVPQSPVPTVPVIIYIVLTAYITAATIEEIMKAAAVRWSCGAGICVQRRHDYSSRRTQTYATAALFIAAALGFSSAENLLYIFGASISASAKSGWARASDRLLVAFIRGCISMPIHCICSGFTALRLTLRDAQRARKELLEDAADRAGLYEVRTSDGLRLTTCPSVSPTQKSQVNQIMSSDEAAVEAERQPVWSWWRVLWPAIAVHGTFDCQAMLLGAVFHRTLHDYELTPLTIIIGIVTQVLSYWILRQQYAAVFESVGNGKVLDRLTLGVHWALCYVPQHEYDQLPVFVGSKDRSVEKHKYDPLPVFGGSKDRGVEECKD